MISHHHLSLSRVPSLFSLIRFSAGTNFGKTQGGPGITTTYDYDAPIDEFGRPHHPKFSHLAEAHALLNEYVDALLTGPYAPPVDLGSNCQLYLYNVSATPVAFLVNNNPANGSVKVTFASTSFTLDPWSVTVVDVSSLTVRYNSQRFSAATVAAAAAYSKAVSAPLSSWSPAKDVIAYYVEPNTAWPMARDTLTQQGPAEQLTYTHYMSKFLWYVTQFKVSADVNSSTLDVSDIGDYFYVTIDGSPLLLESGAVDNDGAKFTLNMSLTAGTHELEILSNLLGVTNGASKGYTEMKGIQGRVTLNGVDLTGNQWTHITGLQGEQWGLYKSANQTKVDWQLLSQQAPPAGRRLWYRFDMPTPEIKGGKDVSTATFYLDMSSMKKGQVYMNGFFVGPYWNIMAPTTGCETCSPYTLGAYNPAHCRYDCGQPSQSQYHVPRDVLKPVGELNYVVVLEEVQSGDPTKITFNQRG